MYDDFKLKKPLVSMVYKPLQKSVGTLRVFIMSFYQRPALNQFMDLLLPQPVTQCLLNAGSVSSMLRQHWSDIK